MTYSLWHFLSSFLPWCVCFCHAVFFFLSLSSQPSFSLPLQSKAKEMKDVMEEHFPRAEFLFDDAAATSARTYGGSATTRRRGRAGSDIDDVNLRGSAMEPWLAEPAPHSAKSDGGRTGGMSRALGGDGSEKGEKWGRTASRKSNVEVSVPFFPLSGSMAGDGREASNVSKQ
mmetsp:Transcript_49945/g.128534  ORF Transcript_49945/g.128534 Transcript_49945/m.128534 type:complete len:172 (-) Transcript_49945:255-770(-)